MQQHRDTDAESMNQRGAEYLPGLLGLVVTATGENWLQAELKVEKKHLAPNGFMHAGSVVTLADSACGYACMMHRPEGSSGFTTLELKCNFVSTAREGVVECEAKAVHLGRNTQVWDATVRHRDTGKLMATFRCTQMILWPK